LSELLSETKFPSSWENTGNFRYSLADGTTTVFSAASRHPTICGWAHPHVISALREKRALVAGLIEKLERKLEQHRADLTHIDGVLRLFQPDRDPAEIKPKRTYARRTRYFGRNELGRLVMDVLRSAGGGLMTTDEIASRIIEAKGFDSADAALRKAIGEQALALLRSFRKRGTVEQIGLGRGVRWKGAQPPRLRGELPPFEPIQALGRLRSLEMAGSLARRMVDVR
jgi:hypothetical protein